MHNLVPHFILKQYAAGELNGRFLTTALFVDISGFSAITDALMQHGQHGAEVLATVMNSVFEPLITTVYEQGGFVSGFAGDAFTAVFPDSPLHALAARMSVSRDLQKCPNTHSCGQAMWEIRLFRVAPFTPGRQSFPGRDHRRDIGL